MWRATLKAFLAHRFRLLLTTFSVVLGVAFVAGTYVLTDTMERTFDDLFTDIARGVDVYVRAESSFDDTGQISGERVPEEVLDTVSRVDGVAFAEGEVTGYAQIVDPEGEAITTQAPTIGVSWPEHEGIGALVIRQGRGPERDGEVAIDAATAARYAFRVGDRVRILFQGPSEEFTVTGIAGFGEADNLAGATLAAFEVETAQRVLGAGDAYDAIAVVGEGDVRPTDLRDRIAARLDEGIEATTGDAVAEEQASGIKEGLSFFSTTLLIFAGVALFVGAFIIFNTFNILVTQRTRELGVLRALGAGGGQVLRSVLLEALLVGVLASAIGVGAGVLLAIGLRALMSAFGIDLPQSGLVLLPRTIVVAAAVGILVTLAASILPARRAARTAPIAAIREGSSVRPVPLGRRSAAGLAVTAVGVGLLLWGLLGDGGLALVGAGVAITFLGVAVLSPVLSRPLADAIGAPSARISLAGKLGRENAMRNPRRTAATSSALMVGLALVGTFLILGESLRATIRQTLDEAFKADYVLSSTSFTVGFSPTVADRLREAPAIETVSELRLGQWREPGSSGTRFLTGVEPSTLDRVLDIEVVQGDLADLRGDAVFVFRSAAEDDGLDVGDTLRMEFAAAGVRPMRVAGIFDNNVLLANHLIPLETYERTYAEQLDQQVLLDVSDEVSADGSRRLIEQLVAAQPNIEIQDQQQVREEQEGLVNQLLGLLTALLGLAILIALLGIVNTLALSVLERTRELGLLRAIGMSRRQVRSMVRWESVIIALIGGVIGLVIGGLFGWALVAALRDEGITAFAVPAGQLVLFLVLAGLLGVIAGIVPARRAARLDVLRAIAYE